MTTNEDMQSWVGRTAVGPQGEKVGKIVDIYLDDQTGVPEWLAVSTGLLGGRVSFVPLQGATAAAGDVRLRFSKDKVKDAPSAQAEGHLSMKEEEDLYRHYGVAYSDAPSDSGLPVGGAPRQEETDDAMTRSEEELRVGKTTREVGRARLRKWVDTEHVTQTVPVTREEVRVEREPITDANIDRAMSGPEIAEGVVEVPLMEEQAVATRQVVPKERIRLETETVTETAEVGADLRREHVETEVDAPRGS